MSPTMWKHQVTTSQPERRLLSGPDGARIVSTRDTMRRLDLLPTGAGNRRRIPRSVAPAGTVKHTPSGSCSVARVTAVCAWSRTTHAHRSRGIAGSQVRSARLAGRGDAGRRDITLDRVIPGGTERSRVARASCRVPLPSPTSSTACPTPSPWSTKRALWSPTIRPHENSLARWTRHGSPLLRPRRLWAASRRLRDGRRPSTRRSAGRPTGHVRRAPRRGHRGAPARRERRGAPVLRVGRPGAGPTTVPPLRITTLGSLRLECGGIDLGGEWLDHRAGPAAQVPDLRSRAPSARPGAGRDAVAQRRQPGAHQPAPGGPRSPRPARARPARSTRRRASSWPAPTRTSSTWTSIVVDADEFEREATAALLTAERLDGAEAKRSSPMPRSSTAASSSARSRMPTGCCASAAGCRASRRASCGRSPRRISAPASSRPRRARCTASPTSIRSTSTPSGTSSRR